MPARSHRGAADRRGTRFEPICEGELTPWPRKGSQNGLPLCRHTRVKSTFLGEGLAARIERPDDLVDVVNATAPGTAADLLQCCPEPSVVR
jgi:hypothetical protein